MKFVAICATLASLRSVVTAFDCTPTSGVFEILTLQDISNINGCKTFTGNITFGYAVEWSDSESISFDGLEQVVGSLKVDYQNVIRSISSSTLRSVDFLRLQALTNLTSASFPALNNFTELELFFLPELRELQIPSENVASEIRKITINSAGLNHLDWMIYTNIKSLSITFCPLLTTLRLPKNTVVDLKQTYEIQSLPNLTTLDVSELVSVSGSFGLWDTTAKTLNFSKLESVSGVMTIERSEMTDFVVPTLTNVTGLVILESYNEMTNTCRDVDTKWPSHFRCGTTSRPPTMASGSWVDTPAGGRSLSAGAISGIVIGSLAGFAILLGAALLWRRRRQALKRNPPAIDDQKTKDEKRRFSLQELEGHTTPLELSNGKERQELPHEDIKESDGASVKELDATGENARRGSLNAGDRGVQEQEEHEQKDS